MHQQVCTEGGAIACSWTWHERANKYGLSGRSRVEGVDDPRGRKRGEFGKRVRTGCKHTHCNDRNERRAPMNKSSQGKC